MANIVQHRPYSCVTIFLVLVLVVIFFSFSVEAAEVETKTMVRDTVTVERVNDT